VIPRYSDDRHFPTPIWAVPRRERAPNPGREARAARLPEVLLRHLGALS